MSRKLRYALSTENDYRLDAILRSLPASGGWDADRLADGRTLIWGEDWQGWTLDGYCIPRLASGRYYFREVDRAEAMAAKKAGR